MLTSLKRVRWILLLIMAFSVVSFADAQAAGGVLGDQASCEALGGVWDNSNTTIDICSVGGSLAVNSGETLIINFGILLRITGTLTNDGTIDNSGFLQAYGGVITNNGVITTNGPGVPQVSPNGTVATANNGALTNNGTINNEGGTINGVADNTSSLDNNGTVNNRNAIMFGNITNHGTINSEDGYINSRGLINDGIITINRILVVRIGSNTGTIHSYSEGLILVADGPYNLTNEAGGIIINDGRIENDSSLNNMGDIINNGSFDNGITIYSAQFVNSGNVTNRGQLINAATSQITNAGTVRNFGTTINNGGITNNGTFINECAGIVTNNGTFVGNAIVQVSECAGAIEFLAGDVQDLVDAGVLNGGQGNALTSKLENAIKKLEQGKPEPAREQLLAFIDQVNNLIQEGVLTPDEGQPLIDAAQSIVDALASG